MTSHPFASTTALLVGLAVLLPSPRTRAGEPTPPTELDDRITAVTVYSDQAAVTRSATARLPAGTSQVAFDPLPAGARPATVQVEAEGARILAVEVLPPWPVRPGDDRAAALGKQRRLVYELADLQPRYDALWQEASNIDHSQTFPRTDP